MDKLTLADIQALAASPDYGGRGFLQPSSAALGLSAALFLSDLTLWQGAGYKLTDGEIDDIQAMIAQLEEDLMVTGDMYPIDKCKVTHSLAQTVPSSADYNLIYNTDIYDPEDMHNPVSGSGRIYVLRSGLHQINVGIDFAPNAIGYRELNLLRHDSSVPSSIWLARAVIPVNSGAAPTTLFLSVQDEAEAGDYYYTKAYQTSGGDLNIYTYPFTPRYSVVRL